MIKENSIFNLWYSVQHTAFIYSVSFIKTFYYFTAHLSLQLWFFLFPDQAMLICMTLAANRLLIAEDSSAGLYQKIILNATVDDLYYALNVS